MESFFWVARFKITKSYKYHIAVSQNWGDLLMKKLLIVIPIIILLLAACAPQIVQQGGVVERSTDVPSPTEQNTAKPEAVPESTVAEDLSDTDEPVAVEVDDLSDADDAEEEVDVPSRGGDSSSDEANSSYTDETIVYTTKTGKKYHTKDCSYLSKSKIPMSLEQAKQEGLTPCSRCHPPT
jgi:hypothetical protein